MDAWSETESCYANHKKRNNGCKIQRLAGHHGLYNAIKEGFFAKGEVFFVDIGLLMGAKANDDYSIKKQQIAKVSLVPLSFFCLAVR